MSGRGQLHVSLPFHNVIRDPLKIFIYRSSQDTEDGENDCPTCQAFSSSCCQGVEGARVFQELQV